MKTWGYNLYVRLSRQNRQTGKREHWGESALNRKKLSSRPQNTVYIVQKIEQEICLVYAR